MWGRLQNSSSSFFAWIASVNDDLTGANENPHLLGALAKMLVIIALAAVAFTGVIVLCRVLGLI